MISIRMTNNIRFLFDILVNDARSILCHNLRYLQERAKVNPLNIPSWKFKSLLPRNLLPQNEQWRVRWLDTLLEARKTRNFVAININEQTVESMLLSICIT